MSDDEYHEHMNENNSPEEYQVPFEGAVEDLKVMKAVLNTDYANVTDVVINGVFRWFVDVELELPLPVMPLEDKQRNTLALTIVNEMLDNFEQIRSLVNDYGVERFREEIDSLTELAPNQVVHLDNLWRELAGCYSELINKGIPKLDLSPEDEEELYSGFITKMAGDLEISEDEARNVVRNDSAFRLMLRRQGINPDRIP